MSLVPHVYCVDNPLRWVDPLGLRADYVDLELGGGSTSSPSPAMPTPTAPDTSGAVQGAGTSKFATGTVWVVEPTEGLNLRTEADVNSKRICGLSKGTQVISLGETKKKGDNLWLKVSVNGQVGWVASEYLIKVESNTSENNYGKQITETEIAARQLEIGNSISAAEDFLLGVTSGVSSSFGSTFGGIPQILDTFIDIIYHRPLDSCLYSELTEIIEHQNKVWSEQAGNKQAYYAGRMVGDVFSLIESFQMISLGAQMMGSGANSIGAGIATTPEGV